MPVVDTLNNAAVKSFSFGDVKITTWGIIGIGIVIVSAFLLIKVTRILLNRYAKRINLDKGRVKSFTQIVKYIVWVIAVILCLDLMHIKVTLLLASAAALLVGVGFGLQNVFSDIISGIIILFDGSIEMDDVIEVNGKRGRVIKIMLRNSILLGADDTTIIIPNRKFIEDNVVNFSEQRNQLTRYSVTVGVAYGSDTQLIKEILLSCAEEHQLIDKNKKPFVMFDNFGDSALIFKLYFWTNENLYIERLLSDVRFMIDKRFRKNNVVIPFPQRDLHIITNHEKHVIKENN